MRYLIIDMDKIADIIGYETLSLKNHKGEEMILTKEESLAKFREIWEEAVGSTVNNTCHAEYHDYEGIEYEWEEFKKTL